MSLDIRLPDWLAHFGRVSSLNRSKGTARLDFFGFFLALVDQLYKLFDQFFEPFRDRFHRVDVGLNFPPDEFQKLSASLCWLRVPTGVLPFFYAPLAFRQIKRLFGRPG